MGFKYINTTCTTKSWGSSEYNENITAKGKITFTDGVFEVAEDNNAYSYVTIPDSDKIYSIEEFQNIFLMD